MTLAAIGFAVLYTVFLWWFSTGAILWLDRLGRGTYRLSLLGASAVAVIAAFGILSSLKDASPAGALLAFTCSLAIWGWHEMSFLMGFITGPRTARCPAGVKGWRRFSLATSTLIYHELALAATAAALLALTWGQPNQIGAWTFMILLVSRLSAKLNIFLGVPNFTEEFFPDHLRYLTSYLRKSPMNALFPLSVTAGLALATGQAWLALDADATPFQVTGFSLMFALTALAVIEHAFMVLPLPDAALWRWAMPAPTKTTSGPSIDV
jgi:putative photosynthetic complex assembly protein 2